MTPAFCSSWSVKLSGTFQMIMKMCENSNNVVRSEYIRFVNGTNSSVCYDFIGWLLSDRLTPLLWDNNVSIRLVHWLVNFKIQGYPKFGSLVNSACAVNTCCLTRRYSWLHKMTDLVGWHERITSRRASEQLWWSIFLSLWSSVSDMVMPSLSHLDLLLGKSSWWL